jgi:hypothetical protein
MDKLDPQDLQSLVFPILFLRFMVWYLSNIFSLVAASLQSAEQYI